MLFAIGVLTAGITAYYMFRMIFITFFGRIAVLDGDTVGVAERRKPHRRPRRPRWVMQAPVAAARLIGVDRLRATALDSAATTVRGTVSSRRCFGTPTAFRRTSPVISELPRRCSCSSSSLSASRIAYVRYGTRNGAARTRSTACATKRVRCRRS